MAFFSGHRSGSKTRQEKMKTEARRNYNKRRGVDSDEYVSDSEIAKRQTAKKAGSKKRPKKAAPKSAPASESKSSTGGPARYKTSKSSTGGPARYKSSSAKDGVKTTGSSTRKASRSPKQGPSKPGGLMSWWKSKVKANSKPSRGSRGRGRG